MLTLASAVIHGSRFPGSNVAHRDRASCPALSQGFKRRAADAMAVDVGSHGVAWYWL
jgi:hypothetical protein